jgi:Fic family protein
MESGNTAQLEDVVAVVKGHPSKLDEGLKREIYNHYAAYLKMLEYLKQHPEGYLDEEIIKDIHEVLVKGIIEEGGVYRNVNISIKGSKYVPCDPIKVYHRMDKYVVQLNEMPNDLDKVIYAHLQLSKIHPFLDGNGRLCRLILNYMLISEGYLPISIPAKRRKEYFATLEAFKVDKTSVPFANLLNDLLNKEYDRLIELIEPHVK